MLPLFNRLRPFLITVFVFLFVSVVLIVLFPKAQLHLMLNSLCGRGFDRFFVYLTYFGDGVVVLILAMLAGYSQAKSKIRYLFLGFSICLIAGLLAQFFKKVVFNGMPRPMGYFTEGALQLVDGVKIHSWNTFPSGHTTSIVTLMLFCAYLYGKKPWIQVLFAVFACGVAYSRVYLSQHFLEDVVGGSVLSILVFFLFARTLYTWFEFADVRWA